MSLPTPTSLWFHNVPGRGGGRDRREDGESGPRVWEGGVRGSQGRARGDGVCRLCPRCRQAHQLAAGLPAAFLPVAKLRLSCVLSSGCKPQAGFAPLSGRRAKLGLPPGADTSKNQQEKTSARPGAVARRPHLSSPRARWVPSRAGGGVPEGGPGVGGRQGSTVWALAWWGW